MATRKLNCMNNGQQEVTTEKNFRLKVNTEGPRSRDTSSQYVYLTTMDSSLLLSISSLLSSVSIPALHPTSPRLDLPI